MKCLLPVSGLKLCSIKLGAFWLPMFEACPFEGRGSLDQCVLCSKECLGICWLRVYLRFLYCLLPVGESLHQWHNTVRVSQEIHGQVHQVTSQSSKKRVTVNTRITLLLYTVVWYIRRTKMLGSCIAWLSVHYLYTSYIVWTDLFCLNSSSMYAGT